VEHWPNEEGSFSVLDDEAEAADLVISVFGDGTILKRVTLRLYSRSGRRTHWRRLAEGRIAIAANPAEAEPDVHRPAAVCVLLPDTALFSGNPHHPPFSCVCLALSLIIATPPSQ